MKTPRFTVGSVTGYGSPHPNGCRSKPTTIWYVHDTAYNHQIILACRGHTNDREARARNYAKQLNLAHLELHLTP